MEIILLADSLKDVAGPKSGSDGLAMWLALCAAILFVSAWLMLRGRFLKVRQQSVRTTLSTDELNTAVGTQLDQVLETYETVRELNGKLDTKIRILDAFIRDADRAAARLEAAQRGEKPPVHPDRSAESCTNEIYLYTDYGFSPSDIASRLELPVESVEQILANRP